MKELNLSNPKELLRIIRQLSFREFCRLLLVSNGNNIPLLNDDIIAAMYMTAKEKLETKHYIRLNLKGEGAEHFFLLQEMGEDLHPFFVRFLLFYNSETDRMLVGFGANGNIYAVGAWDKNGHDLWFPKINKDNILHSNR